MIPFFAAGAAAGGLSYYVGLPLAYAAFLAVAVVAVAVGVTSALIVKVPQVEPKPRKSKADKVRRSVGTSEETTDTPSKTEKTEETKSDSKAANKRDKERAKRAAKKEAEEKARQAEAERVAEEQAEAERQAAEEAEKARLAALEAEDEDEDEAPSKKKNKKKKKKTEEKKGDSTASSKPSESKTAPVKNESTKKNEVPTAIVSKNDAKKNEVSMPSKKADVPKGVEQLQPAAAPERKTEEKETKLPPQDSAAWEEVKGSKKKRGIVEVAPVPNDALSPSASASDRKTDIFLDPKSFGVIIGKAGATLKLITEATQTKIDLSKEEGRVTVSGSSQENIDKAIETMKQLADKGHSVLTHGRRDEGSIEVPPSKRSNVIGINGQTVKLIQEKLKVKVNLPDRSAADSTVTVLGDNANVQEAIKCIQELIDKGFSEVTHPGYVSETIEVPEGQIGNIIGVQGATIKTIQDTTGAKLNIQNSSVVVVGQRPEVTEAVSKITAILTPVAANPDPEWSLEAASRLASEVNNW